MRSAGQIPLSRALDNARKEAAVQYSGTAANGATETISPLIFHPAIPIQPPPLRGTSFHRKEGVSTQAPSFGRGCRAQRGGVGFLFCGEAASSLPSPLGKEDRAAVDRVLSYIVDLRRSSSLSFIPLEPYPARSARHLPHAGKAVCRGYRFPHPTSAPSGHLLP